MIFQQADKIFLLKKLTENIMLFFLPIYHL